MKNIRFKRFNNFFLRSPLKSLDFLLDITEGRNITDAQLIKVFSDDHVKEAIYIASPNLYRKLSDWCNSCITDSKEIKKLRIAFIKYLTRMSSRSTPFGLFAGYNVGQWSDTTEIELTGADEWRKSTRLDMYYLCNLIYALMKDEKIVKGIKFYPNSSLYFLGDEIRYVEYRYKNNKRSHHIVSVDRNRYLEQIIIFATKGKMVHEIVDILVNDEISEEEALDFVKELIKEQLIVGELEPAVTGEDLLKQIYNVISRIESVKTISETIETIIDKILLIDNKRLGDGVELFEDTKNFIKNHLDIEFKADYIFQTDLVKNYFKSFLEEDIAKELVEVIEVFDCFIVSNRNSNMNEFIKAFTNRYESREVSLLQVMDLEIGLGYPVNRDDGDVADLIQGFASGYKSEGNSKPNEFVDTLLNRKYSEALIEGDRIIKITAKDLEDLNVRNQMLPDTISLTVKLFFEDGKLKHSCSGAGNFASRLLGRFCYGDDAVMEMAQDITAKEKELCGDFILAEICHLPEARTGNILMRPSIRDYEIPYMGRSTVSEEFRLDLSDLTLAVKEDILVLRSKKLNRKVMPMLSNAHNYSGYTQSVYHFLCDFYSQFYRSSIGFSWGKLSDSEYLPRVEYKNTVLSPEKWKLKVDEMKDVLKLQNYELIEKFDEYRSKRKIPSTVYLVERDNLLYLNLQNSDCLKVLADIVRKKRSIIFEECLLGNGTPVKISGKSMANEIVIPFYRTT